MAVEDLLVDLLLDENDNVLDIIKERLNANKKIDCILVDEVQFLKEAQIDELFEIAVTLNIPIICYGLRTDFKRKLEDFYSTRL